MAGRRRRPLRWLTFIFGTPVGAILLIGAVTGGAASCLGLAGIADAPSKTALAQIPRQLLPIFEQVGAQYHIPWEVLAGIAANECNLGRSADPSCTLQPGATGPGVANAGWAAAPGSPVTTRAAALSQEAKAGDAGNNRTYCGQAMSDLIQHAGGPAGLTEGRTIVGTQC
jgi:hypothetical protein